MDERVREHVSVYIKAAWKRKTTTIKHQREEKYKVVFRRGRREKQRAQIEEDETKTTPRD